MLGNQRFRTRVSDESGMASILVTMIMMIVISLIVLGFAQIARKESRQALDSQLSTQAYYAAESGINDAHNAIVQALKSGGTVEEKQNCAPTNIGIYAGLNPTIDSTNKVSYTCLLVSTAVSDIRQDLTAPMGTSSSTSRVIPIHAQSGSLTKLHITWLPTSSGITTAGCASSVPSNDFTKSQNGAWSCAYGALRMSLVPTTTLDRNTLMANENSFFLYPTTGGAANPSYIGNGNNLRGAVSGMACTSAACTTTLNLPGSSGQYALRVNSIYHGGTLDITAENGAGPVNLTDAQAQIDATGKAQDVLRRVQVRVSLIPQVDVPDYAIESGSSICKRFSTSDGYFNVPGDISNQDPNNPYCKPTPAPPCSTFADVMLTLDASSSMHFNWNSPPEPVVTRAAKLQQVVKNFLQNVVQPSNSVQVGMITFNGDPPAPGIPPDNFFVPMTSAQGPLVAAISAPYPKHCCTVYTSAIQATQNELFGPRGRAGAKKIDVFISDGLPTDSNKATIQTAATALKNQNVSLYTIAINTNGIGNTELNQMAGGPSGQYVDAQYQSQLDAVMQNIADYVTCKVGP